MKCVVTGAAGFIGSHLTTGLLDRGAEILVAGHAIFGAADPGAATRELRAAALAGAPAR